MWSTSYFKFGVFPSFVKITVLLLLIVTKIANATFNLYIGVNEVKTLLGLSNELYYVREGVPNIYALQFTIPVQPHVDALNFTWQTLGQKPLPYVISMDWSESPAMLKPSLNISSKGTIPTEKAETFQVNFPCTGSSSDEVHFELRLNVTSMTLQRTFNVTTIVLKRRRICIKDPQKFNDRGTSTGHPVSTSRGYSVTTGRGYPVTTGRGHSKSSTSSFTNTSITNVDLTSDLGLPPGEESNWIIILLGTASGLALIIAILAILAVAYCRLQKVGGRKIKESNGFLHGGDSSGGNGSSESSASGGSFLTRPDSPHHYSSLSTHQSEDYAISDYYSNAFPFYSEVSSNETYKSDKPYGDSKGSKIGTIPRCKVRLQSVIQEGSFAKIYDGTVFESGGAERKVIVKTVTDHASPVQMALLVQEGLALVGLRQQHIDTVVAVAAEDKVSPFLIYADDGYRNLKRFLQNCRSVPGRSISGQEVVHMGIQIGSGLAFLHRHNFVQRDVAARNCVVDEHLNVKVSDSALARDLFPDDYQCLGGNQSVPIKWSSPEVILGHAIPSLSSDMWSFGVLLWELFTLAQQPYAEVQSSEILNFLRHGYRLAQPFNCPDDLYLIMSACWTWEVDNRPKWSHVLPKLQDLYAQLTQYV